MKVRNIAFFGVMASILSVAGAYAEGTPTTIIATKSYVDTKDATKQDKIDSDHKLSADLVSGLATVATTGSYNNLIDKPTIPTSSNFVTNGTNALDLSADTAKAPSVTAVKGMVTTSQRTATTGTDAAVDTKVPTEKAVATALAAKQNTLSSSNKLDTAYINTGSSARFVTDTEKSTWSGKVGSVTQGSANGTIAVDGTDVAVKGLGSAAYTASTAYDAAGAAATAKSEAIAAAATDATTKANAKVSSATTISSTSTTTAPNEKAVSTALGTKADSSTLSSHTGDTTVHITAAERTSWNAAATAASTALQAADIAGKEDTSNKKNATTTSEWNTAASASSAATDYPTVKAVSTALSAKQNSLTTAQLNAANSGITSTKVGNYDSHVGNSDIHVTASDKTTWSGKQDALTTAQLNAVNSGITADKVSTYDGYASTISGKVTANTAITAKTGNNLVSYDAKGLVTGGTAAGALATKSTIANADVASDAAIAYAKMAAPTVNINGGAASCSAASPCVLSYDGSAYSWTSFQY